MATILKLTKKMWLAMSEDGEKVYNWTTERPSKDNGNLLEGAILVYKNTFKECKVFTVINDSTIEPEFEINELKILLYNGTLQMICGGFEDD